MNWVADLRIYFLLSKLYEKISRPYLFFIYFCHFKLNLKFNHKTKIIIFMKKITFKLQLLCMAVFFSFTFSSCEKDGVYNPSQKISKIYIQSSATGGQKILYQVWSWDKNKLDKIENYLGDTFIYSSTYIYDKNRLSEIIDSDGSYLKIEYNKSNYDKATFYYEGAVVYTINFEYKGNQLVKMTVQEIWNDEDDDYYSGKKQNVLSMFLPVEILNAQASQSISKLNTKGSYTNIYTYEFSYDKKNVKEINAIHTTNHPDSETETLTISYSTYDKNNNPYHGWYDFNLETNYLSKNNPIKYSCRNSDGEYIEYEYSYSYNGKYPKEAILRPVPNAMYRSFYISTIYEYIK